MLFRSNDNLDKSKPVTGAKVYDIYCRACHQKDGKGDGLRFPPLDNSEWVRGDKKRLIRVLLNGLEGTIEVKGKPYNSLMPSQSFLTDEEIAQVLTYVRQNFENDASEVSAGEVSKLRDGKNK